MEDVHIRTPHLVSAEFRLYPRGERCILTWRSHANLTPPLPGSTGRDGSSYSRAAVPSPTKQFPLRHLYSIVPLWRPLVEANFIVVTRAAKARGAAMLRFVMIFPQQARTLTGNSRKIERITASAPAPTAKNGRRNAPSTSFQ